MYFMGFSKWLLLSSRFVAGEPQVSAYFIIISSHIAQMLRNLSDNETVETS